MTGNIKLAETFREPLVDTKRRPKPAELAPEWPDECPLRMLGADGRLLLKYRLFRGFFAERIPFRDKIEWYREKPIRRYT
jgi:hypothetical protein